MDLTELERAGLRTSVLPLDTSAYGRDLWPRTTLALTRGELPPTPAAVAWPRDAGQVAAALEWAGRSGVAVVPWGAGSGVCGAAAGREGALVLDMKRMDALRDLDPATRTVRVQPGLLGQHLEDRLARQGFMTAHSPSSITCSTVGGYVAARSAGQFSSRYGVFDDMLLAAEAVTPTGTLKTGTWTPPGEEDLLPLLSGSEGALGVVTDTLLRVVPLPEVRWLRGYAFSTLQDAWAAMRALMQAELWPCALRLYDPVDTRIGGRAGDEAEAQKDSSGWGVLKGLQKVVRSTPALRRHLLDLPLALPGLVNRLAESLGRDVLLVVGFEGSQELVAAQVAAAAPIFEGARDLGPGPGEHWYEHRHDVSYKLAPVFGGGGFADTMEVAAPWSRLGELHRATRQALGRHAVVMAHFSHAYPQGCSIYFSFAGAGRLDVYDAAWADALQAAREAGGTVTHHHGVGQLKAREAAREYGAAVRVWREAKSRLDPVGIMNPGRMFPAGAPIEPGPPPPEGGPVFAVDADSLLAEIDPSAPIDEVATALARQGLALQQRPTAPYGDWLRGLRRGDCTAWLPPVFAVQARFEDGVSARLGPAPRSAAGPDLRPALLRAARLESVQVPLRRLEAAPIEVQAIASADARDLRPAHVDGRTWTFTGSAAALAALASGGTDAP